MIKSPRIPFMQFRELKCGGQQLVHGIIVNVPVDIAPTINTLPRNMNNTETIAVKFKQKRNINVVNSKKIFNLWQYGKQQTTY